MLRWVKLTQSSRNDQRRDFDGSVNQTWVSIFSWHFTGVERARERKKP